MSVLEENENSQPQRLIKIKILYFAKVKEILKKSFDTLTLEENDSTIKTTDLMDKIISLNPEYSTRLKEVFTNSLISLNDEYIEKELNVKLKNGDEVSLIPPISAG
jgi:molybdopterin converting factor small subunit